MQLPVKVNITPDRLAAYCVRIGLDPEAVDAIVSGACSPTLELLSRIQMAHVCAIPFENLGVLLLEQGTALPLDDASLFDKLVTQRRGGYCFEQNAFFASVLRALGYEVTCLSARVRFSTPREEVPSRTHVFCRTMLEGVPYLVDVGLGGLSPTAPLRMDTTEPQVTSHDIRRVVPSDDARSGAWFHQILIDDQWHDVCEFTSDVMHEIDRELANWWTSTNPSSKFRQNIIAARALPDGSRITLLNRTLNHRRSRNGQAEILAEHHIATRDELHDILRDRFGLEFSRDVVFGVDGL